MTDVADVAEEQPKQKREVISKGARAGLTFAVSRVEKKLRQGRIAKSIGTPACVYLTSVVERVVEELLEKADESLPPLPPKPQDAPPGSRRPSTAIPGSY